MKSDSINDTEM